MIINNSYAKWHQSPIDTTISTKPISDLEFPVVTICPPKGSNTALNYDLMKLKNRTLSREDREFLRMEMDKAFVHEGHKKFADKMLIVANPKNLKQVFSGFHSVPKPYGKEGFEISAWEVNGTFESGRFGQEYRKEDYLVDREVRFVLEHPSNFGFRSLVIDLEVDTRNVEGWKEEVAFLEGSRCT